jgi:CSLREA domain-containing protein
MPDFTAIRRAAAVALALAAAIAPAAATTIPVSTSADIVADDGACSLREAIAAATTDTASGATARECPAGSGADTISVPPMTILLGSALEVGTEVEIVAGNAANTVVDGQGHGPVFLVTGGAVTLRGLTIRGGDAQAGGGVFVRAGSAEIRDARITANEATTGGAGLYVGPGTEVAVRRTTIDANMAVGAFGGGILNQGTLRVFESLVGGDPSGPARGNDSNRAGGIYNSAGAILNLINTTVSGNNAHSPEAGNGGLLNAGFAFLNNVTITLNRGRGNVPASFSGGGLQSTAQATTVVKNSIIAGNDGRGGANDCLGALTTDSVYDLIGDTNGCVLPPIEQPPDPLTFILNTDPLLGPLQANGGPTRTHLPAFNSPAIDAGFPFTPGGPAADACAAADQRGIPRLRCDMGAVERLVQLPTAFTVTTTADAPDARPGDATCATAANACSLRAAIQEANRLPGTQTINIPAGTYTLAIPPADEDGIDADAAGDLDLQGSVILAGAGRATVIVDGGELGRVFDIGPGATATIRQLTVRNGTDLGGGGVRVTSAGLTLDNVAVQDNVSNFKGGGIEVDGLDAVLDMRNSIVRNNRAPFFGGDGGGIAATGQVTISGSSITGNEARGAGGGLWASGSARVVQSTIAGNRAVGGGVFSNGGGISASGLVLERSTVSGNSADAQGGGVFASGSVVNSTISGNVSATSGGGASTSGTLSLLNATLAGNRANAGGNGLFRFGSTSELSLQNTILADPPGSECAGLLPVSRGSNIASDRSCALAGGGDRQATDALLDPLANTGGPTLTHLPRFNSPAINTATSVGLATDQRGVARPQGPLPDVGAVERRQ